MQPVCVSHAGGSRLRELPVSVVPAVFGSRYDQSSPSGCSKAWPIRRLQQWGLDLIHICITLGVSLLSSPWFKLLSLYKLKGNSSHSGAKMVPILGASLQLLLVRMNGHRWYTQGQVCFFQERKSRSHFGVHHSASVVIVCGQKGAPNLEGPIQMHGLDGDKHQCQVYTLIPACAVISLKQIQRSSM